MICTDAESIALLGTTIASVTAGVGILMKWFMGEISRNHSEMREVIDNNTAALATVAVTIEKCKKTKGG